MMNAKRSFVVFVLFLNLPRGTSQHTETDRPKRMLGYNAFSNDINKCLFQFWTPFVGKNPHPGLSKLVDCKGKGLCYGENTALAQYAACYDQQTLIPAFTGHIVHPNIGGEGREDEFRADTGIEPVATDADYRKTQMGLYLNYESQTQQFFARGHLTPNADFSDERERVFTMITTNIAPQWQLFNAGNWNNLENAIRKYATQTEHALYVFTGTGGAATNFKGEIIKLNGRVLAPKWYWKAVCDPIAKQSVFFLGENTIGDGKGDPGQVKGCYGKWQTKRLGVIQCYSLSQAKKDHKKEFQIPVFHEKNCIPSEIGENFKTVIETNLK